MKALKNCIRFLLPFFILQLLHFKYISILPDTAFMFAYQLPSHPTSFLDVCAQWLLPISAILYFSVYDTDFLYDLQFTTPSGLHSVLERPFSEANGRPFLVKRSPLIVC